jgi:hypothetical protein
MSKRFPRCNECGRPMTGTDLWVRRYAGTLAAKKCGECLEKLKEGERK